MKGDDYYMGTAKQYSWQIKENDQMVPFYPKTSIDQIVDLEEHLPGDILGLTEVISDTEVDLAFVGSFINSPIPVPERLDGDGTVYYYDGTAKKPHFSNLTTSKVKITGTESAILPGTYTISFEPAVPGYVWEDNNMHDVRTHTWTIVKSDPILTSSINSFILDLNTLTTTFTITTNDDADGELTIISSAPNNLKAELASDGTVTLTALNNTTAVTVTINLAEGDRYVNKSIILNGSVSLIGELYESSPEVVQYVADNNLADDYWSIGDYFPMTLNGTWIVPGGTITLTNYVIRCILIGIDHNDNNEGTSLLHFAMLKDNTGRNVAFVGSKFNEGYTTSGGWESSDVRNTALQNLLYAIIPSEWGKVIKQMTKYSNNVGDLTDNLTSVTATLDKIFLLSEKEITGDTTECIIAESSKQLQYDYFANGNSVLCFAHDSAINSTATVKQYTRSTSGNNLNNVAGISNNGTVEAVAPNSTEIGIIPAFCIGKLSDNDTYIVIDPCVESNIEIDDNSDTTISGSLTTDTSTSVHFIVTDLRKTSVELTTETTSMVDDSGTVLEFTSVNATDSNNNEFSELELYVEGDL